MHGCSGAWAVSASNAWSSPREVGVSLSGCLGMVRAMSAVEEWNQWTGLYGRVVSLIAVYEESGVPSEDLQEGSGARDKCSQRLRRNTSTRGHRCVRRWGKAVIGGAKVGGHDD